MDETTQMRCTLDDGSVITCMWLGNGSLSLHRYKAGHTRDDHSWLCVGNGVIDAEAVGVFLAAAEPPPPRAA